MNIIQIENSKGGGSSIVYTFSLFIYLKNLLLLTILAGAFLGAKGNSQGIETFIKIWGVLKYHHPNITKYDINWDQEFVTGYNYLVSSSSCDSVVKYYQSILDDDYKQSTRRNKTINSRLSWINEENTLNIESKEYLINVISAHNFTEHKYISSKNRNILSFHEPDSVNFQFDSPGANLLPLARYWNIMNYFNPYIELLGDWGEVLKKLIVPFQSINSESDYIKCLHLLNATIQDSHSLTSIFPINKTAEFFGNRLNPDFKLDVASDTIFISEVSESKESGLSKGDILLSMNSEPVQFWIDSMSKIGSYSFRDLNRMKVIFELSNEQNRLLEFSRGDSSFSRNIAFVPRNELDLFQYSKHDETIPSNILYINPLNYTPNELKDLRKEAKNKDGVILDLRNYPKENFIELEKLFAIRYRRIYTFKVPNLDSPGTFRSGNIRSRIRGRKIRKPIVVLVDYNTKSASELTVLSMQQRKNIKTVGTHTAGASGTVNFIPMPGNFIMLFSSIGIYNLDGDCFQFNGVNIDYPLKLSIQDKLNGDAILQHSIKILQSMKND